MEEIAVAALKIVPKVDVKATVAVEASNVPPDVDQLQDFQSCFAAAIEMTYVKMVIDVGKPTVARGVMKEGDGRYSC